MSIVERKNFPYNEILVRYLPCHRNEEQLKILGNDIAQIYSDRYFVGPPIRESQVDKLVAANNDGHNHKKFVGQLAYSNRREIVVRLKAIRRLCLIFYLRWFDDDDVIFSESIPNYKRCRYVRTTYLISDMETYDMYRCYDGNRSELKQIKEWIQKEEYDKNFVIDLSKTYTYDEVQARIKWDRQKFHVDDGFIKKPERKTGICLSIIKLKETLEHISKKYRFRFLEEALKDGGIEKFMI